MTIKKVIAVNLAAILAVVVAAEMYCANKVSPLRQSSILKNIENYFGYDPELGYGGKPNAKTDAIKLINNQVVYSVHYELNEFGLRKISHYPEAQKAILLYGDSFTFGEGVQHNFAEFLRERLGRKYKIINLAFHGYGAHQMLRSLEINRESGPLGGIKPIAAFYLSNFSHVRRAAGISFWDFSGPRYEISEETIKYFGSFYSLGAATTLQWIQYSSLGFFIFYKWYQSASNKISPKDYDRYLKIVEKSDALLKAKYHIPLHLIIGKDWDIQNLKASKMESLPLPMENITKIIPNSVTDHSYYLTGDGHPTEKYHRELGEWLTELIRKM